MYYSLIMTTYSEIKGKPLFEQISIKPITMVIIQLRNQVNSNPKAGLSIGLIQSRMIFCFCQEVFRFTTLEQLPCSDAYGGQ